MAETPKAVTLRFDAEQAEALEYISEVDGVSVSEAVRDAIEGHIETRRAQTESKRGSPHPWSDTRESSTG